MFCDQSPLEESHPMQILSNCSGQELRKQRRTTLMTTSKRANATI